MCSWYCYGNIRGVNPIFGNICYPDLLQYDKPVVPLWDPVFLTTLKNEGLKELRRSLCWTLQLSTDLTVPSKNLEIKGKDYNEQTTNTLSKKCP